MTGHETPHRLSTGKQRLSCPHHLRPICLPHHVRGGACVSWMTGSSFILLQFLSHSRWVGTRRVALPYVSSCPPLKTVRTTFMVYGLAPAVSLRACTKRSFPFRQLHRAFPVDSLRVRWVPLVQSFRRLGAFAMSPHPRVDSFPVLRLLC